MYIRPLLARQLVFLVLVQFANGGQNLLRADDSKAKNHYEFGRVSISLQASTTPTFVIEGLKLESVRSGISFSVVRSDNENSGRKIRPISGKFAESEGSIEFVPRFKLDRSLTYALNLDSELSQSLNVDKPIHFRLPKPPPQPQATVSEIYPTSDHLPENVLKFYIHFSAPMSRGDAYEHIHLLHKGKTIQRPFLELGEELWDRDQKRFTLFVHPGRIKQGLRPREEDGAPMESGESYTLRIDKAWKSADGQPMATTHEKKFTVVESDDERLNPETWKIETPSAATKDPVRLVFDEPLDHAMLQRVLTISHRDGTAITGTANIVSGETNWSFEPAKPWAIGTYDIFIATNLEDLCGNSIARPFETKMQDRAASQPTTQIAVEFIVK